MIEPDYSTFARAFGRVCGAFRLKLKPVELEELTRTYFRVLEAFPLDEVLLAGKTCLATHRSFPRAADWLAALASTSSAASCPADRRQMTVAELDEQANAERLRYFDHACLCSECCRAGVDERPIRFVPTLLGLMQDEEERAFNPRRNRLEVIGHWAHGDELLRWYAARDAFFTHAKRCRVPVRALALVSREPGQEG